MITSSAIRYFWILCADCANLNWFTITFFPVKKVLSKLSTIDACIKYWTCTYNSMASDDLKKQRDKILPWCWENSLSKFESTADNANFQPWISCIISYINTLNCQKDTCILFLTVFMSMHIQRDNVFVLNVLDHILIINSLILPIGM